MPGPSQVVCTHDAFSGTFATLRVGGGFGTSLDRAEAAVVLRWPRRRSRERNVAFSALTRCCGKSNKALLLRSPLNGNPRSQCHATSTSVLRFRCWRQRSAWIPRDNGGCSMRACGCARMDRARGGDLARLRFVRPELCAVSPSRRPRNAGCDRSHTGQKFSQRPRRKRGGLRLRRGIPFPLARLAMSSFGRLL